MGVMHTSPLEIMVLLHYYCRVGDHHIVADNPPIWPSLRERFLSEGLLALPDVPGDATYLITARGRAHVEALLSVPFPEQTWVTRWPSIEVEG